MIDTPAIADSLEAAKLPQEMVADQVMVSIDDLVRFGLKDTIRFADRPGKLRWPTHFEFEALPKHQREKD
jgi:hypothetical protein